jgi:hypothetical protein
VGHFRGAEQIGRPGTRYVSSDGTLTREKKLAAKFSTYANAEEFAQSKNIRLDGTTRYILGYVVLGLLSVPLLIVSLVSAGKEHRSGERLKGLVFFTIAVIMGLCTLGALTPSHQ